MFTHGQAQIDYGQREQVEEAGVFHADQGAGFCKGWA